LDAEDGMKNRRDILSPRPHTFAALARSGLLVAALVALTFMALPFDAAAQAQGGTIIIANAPYPPFVMPEGHALGPGIDMEIAIEALRRMGIRASVQMYPFTRVLAALKSGEAQLTTTLSFNAERDAYLRWSAPYRSGSGYLIFTLRSAGLKPAALEDLHGKSVGVVRGFVYPPAFSANAGIAKIEAPDSESLIKMFFAGRFDAIITNSIVGSYDLKATGRMAETYQSPFILQSQDNRATLMGFSKQAVSADTIERFNRELSAMQADGTMARIERKYLD
jgi:polar amino acid transport system substrate-binding protein